MSELGNLIRLFAGGLCLILLAVIVTRLVATLRTRRWIETEAKIVTSEPRRIRPGESGPEIVPNIVYEYTVDGEVHRGHRLKAPGIPIGELDLGRFLNLYPVGASAHTYYDPANPKEAILEREPLSLTFERLGCLSIFVVSVVLLVAYGLAPLHRLVLRWFPNAENENVLIIATGLGVYLTLFGLMWLLQGRKEHRWPSAAGTVVSSGIEDAGDYVGGVAVSAAHVKLYQAAVIYAYEVRGRRYESKQIRRERTSGSKAFAEASAAKYPVGSPVRAYYNPANPAEAVLKTGAALGVLVLWGIALVMFTLAASVSGYFRHS